MSSVQNLAKFAATGTTPIRIGLENDVLFPPPFAATPVLVVSLVTSTTTAGAATSVGTVTGATIQSSESGSSLSSTPSTGVVSSCDPDQPYSSFASSEQFAPNQEGEEEYLSDTCSHCAISRGGVSVTVTSTETTAFPRESVASLSTGNLTSSQVKGSQGDQGTRREEEEAGVMDATAPYMMTNVNTSAPALLSTPATHHHHPGHHQHSHHSPVQYQSPPNTTTHSVPLLATPVLSMVDSHYLTQTGQAVTLINPATCLTSNNNDPQQLQHVMIPGMVPTTTFQDNGYSGTDQLPSMDATNSMDGSLIPNGGSLIPNSGSLIPNGGSLIPNSGSSSGQDNGDNSDQLRTALRQQLEYYFSKENLSHDVYLLTQMDSEQYVPISTIAGFEKVRKLTDDKDLIVQVLRESQVVQVDESGSKVKPIRDRKGVLILREIPDGTSNEEIESLFNHDSCPRFVSVEYICNRNWYVTFDSDEDAQRALKYLTEYVKDFNGCPLLARIKARTAIQASSYSGGYKVNSVDPRGSSGTGGMGPDQGASMSSSRLRGRQLSSESGASSTSSSFVAVAPVQGYQVGPPATATHFYHQSGVHQPGSTAMIQTWGPGTTTCYDLSSVINFNGLSPQLAYKPINTGPGPRSGGSYRGGYNSRKNYHYNNHNGPRSQSMANSNNNSSSTYHYNQHVSQNAPSLVTVPHSMNPVPSETGSYHPHQLGSSLMYSDQCSSHFTFVNGNSNLVNDSIASSEKGGHLNHVRLPSSVPHSSNNQYIHSGHHPSVLNAQHQEQHSSYVNVNQGPGMVFQHQPSLTPHTTNSYNNSSSFKQPSQPSASQPSTSQPSTSQPSASFAPAGTTQSEPHVVVNQPSSNVSNNSMNSYQVPSTSIRVSKQSSIGQGQSQLNYQVPEQSGIFQAPEQSGIFQVPEQSGIFQVPEQSGIGQSQLNYQVPEFVPSSCSGILDPALSSSIGAMVESTSTPVESNPSSTPVIEPRSRSGQVEAVQQPLINGHHHLSGGSKSGFHKSASGPTMDRQQSKPGVLTMDRQPKPGVLTMDRQSKPGGNRNRRGGDRGGMRRDHGDNASNCSGTSGQSGENYPRNGDEKMMSRDGHRDGGHRDNRHHRDHHRRDHRDSGHHRRGDNDHRDSGHHKRGDNGQEFHSNQVAPQFDLKDSAFPPLPFTNSNDATISTSIDDHHADEPESSDHIPRTNSMTSATGCLADVVKGITISSKPSFKDESLLLQLETSRKSLDSSSCSNQMDMNRSSKTPRPDSECNGNGSGNGSGNGNGPSSPSNDLRTEMVDGTIGANSNPSLNNCETKSEGQQNRWVRPPRPMNQEEARERLARPMNQEEARERLVRPMNQEEARERLARPMNQEEARESENEPKGLVKPQPGLKSPMTQDVNISQCNQGVNISQCNQGVNISQCNQGVNISPCNGHESSDTDDQQSNNLASTSSKSMSFADVARLAKSKQTESTIHPSSSQSASQRNSVGKESVGSIGKESVSSIGKESVSSIGKESVGSIGKESVSSIASTVSNSNADNTSSHKLSGQNSKHSNRGASIKDAKMIGSASHRDGGHRNSSTSDTGDNNNSRPPRERRDRNKGSRRGGGNNSASSAGSEGKKQDSRPGSRQSVGSSKKGEQVR